MKRGRRPELPSTKADRGTFRPSRDASRVEVIAADAPPQRPEWLTAAGELVWLDDLPRVLSNRQAAELDSTMFAQYCNLQGAINAAWTGGAAPPPAAYLTEARRMAEQFGLFGAKSRIRTADGPKDNNPFSRNGRR
jgi:hypothetical protein